MTVRKDLTLTLGGTLMLDGAKLICKCVNTIVGKDSEGEVYVTLTAFGKSLFDCLFVCFTKLIPVRS